MRAGQSSLPPGGVCRPRRGRAPLFAYPDLCLAPSPPRLELGGGSARAWPASGAGCCPDACECARGRPSLVYRRGWAPPTRRALPRGPQAAASPPAPDRSCRQLAAWRAQVWPFSPGGVSRVLTPGWTRRTRGVRLSDRIQPSQPSPQLGRGGSGAVGFGDYITSGPSHSSTTPVAATTHSNVLPINLW